VTAYGSQGFSYDGNGNLTPSGTQIGAGNRLLQDTLWNYQYDYEGNLIQKTARSGSDLWTYAYDTVNRLIGATETTNVSSTTYTLSSMTCSYDALGRRVQLQEASWGFTPTFTLLSNTTTRFSYDGQVLLYDLSSSNSVNLRYVIDQMSGDMLARLDPTTSLNLMWYLSDKQGGVIDLLDTTGTAWKRIKEGAFTIDLVYQAIANLGNGHLNGWVPNSDGTWTQVDWVPGISVSDRMGYNGQQFDALSSLTYTGSGWYAQDMGRFINEQPSHLEGTNVYRYPLNSPQNIKVIPPKAKDFLEAASNFFAGAADTLTAGMTRAFRQASWTDTVNYESTAYGLGSHVGQAINIGLMFINPAELGGTLGSAAARIQATAVVGNTINGIEAFSQGHVWDGLLAFAGAGLAGVRGVTPCAWRDTVQQWGQKALHGLFATVNVHSAIERIENGDIFGALVAMADAGANAYLGYQSCFAAGTPIRYEFGSKMVEDVREGDLLWSRDEFDPDGELVLKRVEEVFVRSALVLNLHVKGRVIRTTGEHPFYVEGKGWTPCAFLKRGERIRGEKDGEWHEVDAVTCSGEVTTVYNFRIADYHTYFVGCEAWGFSLWAHNACRVVQEDEETILEIDNPYPAESIEYRHLRTYVQKWNEAIENAGGSLTRRTPSAGENAQAHNWRRRMRRAYPERVQDRDVAHIPDAAVGGTAVPAHDEFTALHPTVNAFISSIIPQIPLGTTYHSVRLVK
jgi:RHS repeat-associated protein